MRIIFFLFLILSLNLNGQNDSLLIPYRSGDKWGFSDVYKRMVIPSTYAAAMPFNHGKAFVIDENKIGYIINRDNVQFVEYGNVPEELWAIRLDIASNDIDKYSYPKEINMEEELTFVIPEKIKALGKLKLYSFFEASDIKENKLYDLIIPRTDQTYFVFKDKKAGLIDSLGNVLIPVKYDALVPYYMLINDDFDFHKHLMKVILNNKEGYVSLKGVEYFD